MKNNRFLCWCLGASLAVALTPLFSFAQATGGTAAAAGTSVGTGGVGTGTGATGNTGTNTSTSNSSAAATAVKSVTSGAGSATSIPSNANVFVQTYVDPLSMGLSANWLKFGIPTKPAATFGKVLYTGSNSTAKKGATAGGANQQGGGFTTYGTPRTPPFSTSLDPENLPFVLRSAPRLEAELRDGLARSSYLSNQQNIQIVVNGSTVELRGQVSSEKERRTAVGIVGVSPGVTGVVDQLQVMAPSN